MCCENLSEKEFKNPSNEFRPVPFWSWNDRLNAQELRRQIDEMKSKGIGGFFMHSRSGLITPYLSPEWMDMIKKCVNYAKKVGLYAWLYDEDRWPSGFAGGIVPQKGPEYRMRGIEMREVDSPDSLNELKKEGDPLKVFLCEKEDSTFKSIKDITEKEIQSFLPSHVILYFREIIAPDTSWHNGYPYIDTLNPDAVNAFIESTHKAYYSQVGDEFRRTIPGIFTDEPNYLDFHGYSGEGVLLPWTVRFPEFFYERKRYDILKYLPSLFYEVGDLHKIRYDYWSTVTELFIETFSKKLFEWCDEHRLKLTGHYLGDDGAMFSQAAVIGSAMQHYEYMHIPGIDHLGRNIDDPITMKQVSSVAHQLGKERVLCETYACSGWNISFEEQKWIGDFLYVLGINLLNPSMFSYSLRGCRKRDFPPAISYQQPWWKYYNIITDYFARLSYILTRGEFVTDILLLHPIGSMWCIYSPFEYTNLLRSFFTRVTESESSNQSTKMERLDRQFSSLAQMLLKIHRDFDFGDEGLTAKYGGVKENKLFVGEHSYSIVIIPPCITLMKETFDSLLKFAQNGGKIVAVEPTPYLIEGRSSKDICEFFESGKVRVIETENLKSTLDALIPPDIQITDRKGKEIGNIYYQHRKTERNDIYFFVNIDRKKDFEALIRVKGNGIPEEWNPESGEISPVYGESKDGLTSFHLHFSPVESHTIVLNEVLEKNRESGYLSEKFAEDSFSYMPEVINPQKKWNIERLNPNVLTLDFCRYRIGKDGFSEVVPVWKADRAIKHYYALDDFKGSDGIQFWKLCQESRGGFSSQKMDDLYLKYNFYNEISTMRGDIFLVIETPKKFEIYVNGGRIDYKEIGYWIDPSFKKIGINPLLKKGNNEILLKSNPDLFNGEPLEIESCYIIGDFGVKNDSNERFYLSEETESVKKGNLTTQGFPFYAGTIAYIKEFDIKPKKEGKIYLELTDVRATVVRVLINEKEVGLLFWNPYRLDITEFINHGRNVLRIELTNSLRNLLGPHHHMEKEPFWVGPGHFEDELNWTDSYNFIEFGILGDVRLLRYSNP
jgi:hypothetical protein